MEKQKSNRSRIIGIRLTPQEYAEINGRFKTTTSRKLSDYLRHVLLDGSVTIRMRDQSLDDFMAEMIELRGQFSAAGNNLNQAVKKLHIIKDNNEILPWLLIHEREVREFNKKVEEIKLRINQFADRW
jgi:MobC-like protein